MRSFFFALIVFAFTGTPSHAKMEGCSKTQSQMIKIALASAKRLTVTAAANVYDDPVFETWFGKYSPAAGEVVRANLKSIARAIRTGAVTARCGRVSRDDCEIGTYAYVFSDAAYLINLCPPFFQQPTMKDLRPETERGNNGTRAGTLIHELSHFLVVAETEDHCYSRTECSEMAERDSGRALDNADSYQYFAEDIAIKARLSEN